MRPHWYHSDQVFGCQHPECSAIGGHQWSRKATPDEVEAELALEGPYGRVHRNPTGPHVIAVFGCGDHAPSPDAMAVLHEADCPLPENCSCV